MGTAEMNAKRANKKTGESQKLTMSKSLLADVRGLIVSARASLATTVNSSLSILYWQIGTRIRTDILKEKRADYGEGIVHALSAQLEAEFGRGFNRRNVFNMLRFAEIYTEEQIMHALSAPLTWTHLRQIIYLDDALKRDFYAEMCRVEGWSTRTLQKKIQSMLYERTALSKKPAKLVAQELKQLREEDKLTPNLVFRDPTCWISSVSRILMRKRTSNRPSCERWKRSS